MIAINALANIIPINGITTGGVSAYYENLFTPAGYTFLIWGVIYLLLGIYTFYQGYFSWNKYAVRKVNLFKKIGVWFSISSIANSLWILSWHYRKIPLTVLFILIIFFSLIFIFLELKRFKLSDREKIFIRIPFSIYFGWITVASIANIMVLLVYLNWSWFGLHEYIWTILFIIIGAAISIFTILKNRNSIYGIPIAWAYTGILVRHIFGKGFNHEYRYIIISLSISLLIILMAEIKVIKE